MVTVQELIDALLKVEDKFKKVHISVNSDSKEAESALEYDNVFFIQ